MSRKLPLLLERAIGKQSKPNRLSLPLDRKLGELSRYTYVYASALPLRMERFINEQPAPSMLGASLRQFLGTLPPVLYVTSSALPLPLSVPASEQPASNVLPLGMTRKLGTATGDVIIPPDPTDPTDPELPDRPLMPNIAACFGTANSVALSVNRCYAVSGSNSSVIARDYQIGRAHV